MEEQNSTGKSLAGKGKRKRKVFYCFSCVSWILYVLSSLIIVASIIWAIGMIFAYDGRLLYTILVACSACFLDILMILVFVSQYRGRIIFEEEQISIKDGLYMAGFFKRIQHALTIKYEDIESVFITESTCDSLGNPVRFVFVNMKYIVFHLKSGQMNQMINIYYFSGRQKVKIINEIYTRMGVEYNPESQPGKRLIGDFKIWQRGKEKQQRKKADRMAKKQRKAEQKAERKK